MKCGTREYVDMIKMKFLKGTRIKLDAPVNDDFSKLKAGDEGTVVCVDDVGTIHMKWDSGSGLGLIYREDEFHIIP